MHTHTNTLKHTYTHTYIDINSNHTHSRTHTETIHRTAFQNSPQCCFEVPWDWSCVQIVEAVYQPVDDPLFSERVTGMIKW